MSQVSQAKNRIRWVPPKSVRLRQGQRDLYEAIRNNPKSKYAIQLPTGYGKSWCACIAYATLRSMGTVNRVLIVVPTDQQRSQYIEGLREDFPLLGIDINGIERCDNQATWVLKKSLRNESEVFVAGVQSIASNPGYYADLMQKNRWLVVADEFHHYGEENAWGAAIKDLPYEVILGMSATPFRSDNKLTIFGDCHFDVAVSIEDAFKEEAIKRIQTRIGDYSVSWSSLDDPEPQNSLMSELAQDWPDDVSQYEIKRGIRYYPKYVSEIFLQVLTAWSDYERQWPGQNQILVFAMSCRHAEMITKVINDCAFPGFPQPFADWIGVGDGDTENRSDKENADILKRFQSNELPCLVQVNKASEGFNNKRCSIGLFLDLVGDTPMKRQHIGRFMRVNQKAPGQSSLIFISEDSPCRELLESLDDDFGLSNEEKEKEKRTRESRDPKVVIPDILIIDTAFESERVVYPFGSPEAAISKFLEDMPEAAALCEGMPESERDQKLQAVMEGWLKDQHRRANPPLTSEQRRKQASEQVSRSLGRLAAAILRKRFGRNFPKTAMGDICKSINSRWKRQHGAHAELTESDLQEKVRWLQDLAEAVNNDEIPTWLI